MWFRPRSQPNENDRSRVASFRNRIRSKKSVSKCETDAKDTNAAVVKPITATPNRIRDDSSGYVLRSQSDRRLSLLSDDDDSAKEKNKMLRVDQKYKKNRITKSSSRTKIPDIKIEKKNSGKNLNNNSDSQRKNSTPLIDPTSSVKAKTTRRNTTLNLNALLRYKSFISGSTKKLTSDDFERMRRKSLGDTGKIRRKSNPDADKNDPKAELQQSPSFESDKLSDDDFENDQTQVELSLGKSEKGCNFQSTTSKKTKSKNKKKGFYPQKQRISNEFCAKTLF